MKQGPIDSLTGIRGYAAIWVVLYHMRLVIVEAPNGYIEKLGVLFLNVGYLGVDLFSFLSGFVISYAYLEKLQHRSLSGFRHYISLRLARIYPLLIFMLCVYIIAYVIEHRVNGAFSFVYDSSLWLQITMLNGWGFENIYALNTPSWTVSAEWFCYLCFPLVAPLIALVKNGTQALLFAIATLAATIWVMYSAGHPHFDATLDWGLVRIAGEFLAGCWLYSMHRDWGSQNLPWGWIGLGSLGIGLWYSLSSQMVTVSYFAVLVYALAQNKQPLTFLFCNRISIFLGEISYSIYMTHFFILKYLGMYHGEYWFAHPGRYFMTGIVVVLLISTITFYFIENPARAILRRKVG